MLVSESINLLELHDVIQAVFGWQDYHLHEFEIRGLRYGDPANDEYGEWDMQDEEKIRLREIGLVEGESFSYVYDFGDNWRHTIKLERIRPAAKGTRLPRCLAGERACPPEDVGGIGGYAGFLEALADASHPEHQSYLRWIGGAFDPGAFDLEDADARLAERARERRAGEWWVPPNGGGTATGQLFDESEMRREFSAQDDKTAREAPLRRDVLTLLSYLRDNKVTGTSSTGNLPLKAVAEISSTFVDPPDLEIKVGKMVFRIRSEWEVWPVYLAHNLANAAELIEGGLGRRWRSTQRGERFLSSSAALQVLTLLHTWWYRVDWIIAVRFDIFGDLLSPAVPKVALSLLRALPVEQPVRFESFVERFIEESGWSWSPNDSDTTLRRIRRELTGMLVDPLEGLRVLSSERETEGKPPFELTNIQSFFVTDFGRGMLEALRQNTSSTLSQY